MYRITVPMEDTRPNEMTYNLAQKIKAAISAGLFIALAISIGLSILVWVCILVAQKIGLDTSVDIQAGLFGGALTISIIIGSLVTCRLGFVWVTQVAERPWKVDDRERTRRWKLEDEERKAQEEAAARAHNQVVNEDDTDNNPQTLNKGQRLSLIALEILTRFYILNQPVTREAMTKEEKFCTQPEWGIINAAMKKIGLKQRNTMRTDLDFEQAWQEWRGSVKFEDGYIETLTNNGWKALERL